jgi:SAM-dependent methyltransferase
MTAPHDDAGEGVFPAGFFDRADPSPDPEFYATPRLVTHLDDRAIDAVGALYDELRVTGDVLDLMSSWVSHLRRRPRSLTVLGLNAVELAANPMADVRVVHDLNAVPGLPFADASFDAVLNCVSIDYLVQPVAVLAEVARVLRPGGVSVCTFSNRCFPTKAVRGWLSIGEQDRPLVVAEYHRQAGGFDEPVTEQRLAATWRFDPLWSVWARRRWAPTQD